MVAVARRKCSRSEGAEPKPALRATCSTERSVCSSRRLASSTRWACSHLSGVVPVSATNLRAKVRGLTAARARERGYVERLGEVVERPGAHRLERAVAVARRQGRSMNCDWPPSRCGAATIARATRGADPLAVVGADQVQAEVDPRREPGRREHAPSST